MILAAQDITLLMIASEGFSIAVLAEAVLTLVPPSIIETLGTPVNLLKKRNSLGDPHLLESGAAPQPSGGNFLPLSPCEGVSLITSRAWHSCSSLLV